MLATNKHEEKSCARCGVIFECRSGDVLKCQCYGIALSEAQQAYLTAHYTDCLCRNCLEYLSTVNPQKA
jgi:Cysteine-rich CWC